jgi:hypothetical protein
MRTRSTELPSSYANTKDETPIDRLLEHATDQAVPVKSETCGALLNDFQKILSAGLDLPRCWKHEQWESRLEDDIFAARNEMNLSREVCLKKDASGALIRRL